LALDWTYNVAVGLSTFLEVCEFNTPLREILDGRETISLAFDKCDISKLPETKFYLSNIQGKVWFDATDKVPVRLEAWQKISSSPAATQVSPKVLILFAQKRISEGVWFPALIRVEGVGNEAVFPGLRINWQIEFFDYRLPETEIKDIRVNSK
jgi:hypothetical protein